MSCSPLTLWNYFFPSTPESAAPTGLPLPPEPPKRTEPSCFAKGIAKSIIEEPEAWVPDGHRIIKGYPILFGYLLCIRHRTHGTSLGAETTSRNDWLIPGCRHLYNVSVSSRPSDWNGADVALLAQTIEAHPLGQYKDWLEERRTQEERITAEKDYFNELGCPASPPPPKPMIVESRGSYMPSSNQVSAPPKHRAAKRKAS